MTHTAFLMALAADLRTAWPHTAARLIEVAHDMHALQEFCDNLIGDALAEARRAETEIRDRATAALEQVTRNHTNRTL
jgi:hypothetical protein